MDPNSCCPSSVQGGGSLCSQGLLPSVAAQSCLADLACSVAGVLSPPSIICSAQIKDHLLLSSGCLLSLERGHKRYFSSRLDSIARAARGVLLWGTLRKSGLPRPQGSRGTELIPHVWTCTGAFLRDLFLL